MKNQKRLRLALKANAIFSSGSALAMLLFQERLSEIMNINQAIIFNIIGIGLLFFAGSIFFIASQAEIKKKQVQSIIIQDWIWVIGSVLIVLFQLFNISYTGYLIIAGLAIAVADFAIVQGYFLRRVNPPA